MMVVLQTSPLDQVLFSPRFFVVEMIRLIEFSDMKFLLQTYRSL